MACPYSITVAASNFNDELADFSNYGECVNIIAPVSAHCVYYYVHVACNPILFV